MKYLSESRSRSRGVKTIKIIKKKLDLDEKLKTLEGNR
jgi:hypothetical protein